MKRTPQTKRPLKYGGKVLVVFEWKKDNFCTEETCPCQTCPLWLNESLENLSCACNACSTTGRNRLLCWRTTEGVISAEAKKNGKTILIGRRYYEQMKGGGAIDNYL